VDGSLAGFCTSCPAKGRVFAKPGTVAGEDGLNGRIEIGVMTLGGYLDVGGGRYEVFYDGVTGTTAPDITGHHRGHRRPRRRRGHRRLRARGRRSRRTTAQVNDLSDARRLDGLLGGTERLHRMRNVSHRRVSPGVRGPEPRPTVVCDHVSGDTVSSRPGRPP
jgi:hypothetical protein